MQQSFYLQYTFLHKQLGGEMVYQTMVLVWYCGESFVTSAMSLSLQILSESFHRLSTYSFKLKVYTSSYHTIPGWSLISPRSWVWEQFSCWSHWCSISNFHQIAIFFHCHFPHTSVCDWFLSTHLPLNSLYI